MTYTRKTEIDEVINDPAFHGKGRFLFPVQRGYMSGSTLGSLDLTWYSEMDPDMTAAICNSLKERAEAGERIFFDMYSEEEKKADPGKNDTGLWYFRGKPGKRFAVCSAGGGFAYVGAMHDSLPHAYTLAEKGYHAFALIYRPGAQTACEDLARAIAFIFEHSEELGINTDCYSLWGGSAGARMAAWLGSYGTASFGEKAYPNAGTVVMQYTGLDEVYGNEPPTYNCVGTADWIASDQTMKRRIDRISRNGTDAMIEMFPGLGHGFGLGRHTKAEGWIEKAISFWEKQMTSERKRT